MENIIYIIIAIILIIVSVITGTTEVIFHNTNEVVMTISAYVQALCVVLQSVLIIKQFKLSERIEEKSRAENKGIFILDKTNIFMEDEKFATNKYMLNKEISFHNKGNDHVILKAVTINGIKKGDGYRTFFTNLEEYSKLVIDLELSDEELGKDEIEVNIDLYLENLKGYNYVERLEIQFEKDHDENVFNLGGFNIRLMDKVNGKI